MGSLISREVRSVRGFVFHPWVVSGGTPYTVANETFVVSDMFGALGGGEVDSVYVHCHGVSSGLFGSGVSGGVSLSAP